MLELEMIFYDFTMNSTQNPRVPPFFSVFRFRRHRKIRRFDPATAKSRKQETAFISD